MKPGTKVICYPKEGQSEFIEERGLKDLANKKLQSSSEALSNSLWARIKRRRWLTLMSLRHLGSRRGGRSPKTLAVVMDECPGEETTESAPVLGVLAAACMAVYHDRALRILDP